MPNDTSKLKSDLIDIFFACSQSRLNKINIKWSNKKSLCIVVCSKGFDSFKKYRDKI